LAVLWNFKGLQAQKTTFDISPNLLWFPPPFRRIPDAAAPCSAVSHRMGSEPDGPPRVFVLQRGSGRVHGGEVIRIK
jgi:hypothetical protein